VARQGVPSFTAKAAWDGEEGHAARAPADRQLSAVRGDGDAVWIVVAAQGRGCSPRAKVYDTILAQRGAGVRCDRVLRASHALGRACSRRAAAGAGQVARARASVVAQVPTSSPVTATSRTPAASSQISDAENAGSTTATPREVPTVDVARDDDVERVPGQDHGASVPGSPHRGTRPRSGRVVAAAPDDRARREHEHQRRAPAKAEAHRSARRRTPSDAERPPLGGAHHFGAAPTKRIWMKS
jgi:hypothetical protein